MKDGQQAGLSSCCHDSMTECLHGIMKGCKHSCMIIVIANSKGGVGKSTLAVHLAHWLSQNKQRVVLADCDTQQSSSQWIAEAAPEVHAVRLGNPDQILDTLPQLGEEADYVVADGPGSNTETSRALLLRADFALVPCKASMLEVRALAQATSVLRQSQDIRHGKPDAMLVLSMVGKNYRLTQDMKEAAAALNLPMAETHLTLRQVYADAPGQGTVVVLTDWSDLAQALKRASLERKLDGQTPDTVQEILEELLEPWLHEHGYLK